MINDPDDHLAEQYERMVTRFMQIMRVKDDLHQPRVDVQLTEKELGLLVRLLISLEDQRNASARQQSIRRLRIRLSIPRDALARHRRAKIEQIITPTRQENNDGGDEQDARESA